jgi:hypothetical protein
LLTPQNREMQLLGRKAKAASMRICKPSSTPTTFEGQSRERFEEKFAMNVSRRNVLAAGSAAMITMAGVPRASRAQSRSPRLRRSGPRSQHSQVTSNRQSNVQVRVRKSVRARNEQYERRGLIE